MNVAQGTPRGGESIRCTPYFTKLTTTYSRYVHSILVSCIYVYSLWDSVVAWMRNISVPENYGFDTIICNYFYSSPKRHQGYNYSYHRAQNSYQLFRKPWFDTNVGLLLFLHVTPSKPLLRVILFRSLLLSMLLNYKKLSWYLIDRQLSVQNVNGHAYSYPLPPLWRWGLKLDLNGIESAPENYGFDTMISDYFYRSPCWPRSG